MTSMQAGQSNDAGRASGGTQEAKASDYAKAIKEIIADLREGKELTGAQVKVLESNPPKISELLDTSDSELLYSRQERRLVGFARTQDANHNLYMDAVEEARQLIAVAGLLPEGLKTIAVPWMLNIHRLGQKLPSEETYSIDGIKDTLISSEQSLCKSGAAIQLSGDDQLDLIRLTNYFRDPGELSRFKPEAAKWALTVLRHVSLDVWVTKETVAMIFGGPNGLSWFLEAQKDSQKPKDMLTALYRALCSTEPVQVWPKSRANYLFALGILTDLEETPPSFPTSESSE